jgi:hypothetical protein
MSKVEVNASGTDPVFEFPKTKAPGTIRKAAKLNFTKILVSRDGKLLSNQLCFLVHRLDLAIAAKPPPCALASCVVATSHRSTE